MKARTAKRFGAAVALVIVATGAARAQQQSQLPDKQEEAREAAEKRRIRDRGLEESARNALKVVPDKKYDAWGTMRGAEPKPAK